MSVILTRAYGGFAVGVEVTLPDSTEAALITQGLATAGRISAETIGLGNVQVLTQGGNSALVSPAGVSVLAAPAGPSIVPVHNLTGFAAAGVAGAHVAGTMNLTELFVQARGTFSGVNVLNGAIVGTDNLLVALYSSDGTLIANSAVAGVLSAGANAFQNIQFLTKATVLPGRYWIGVQCSGVTANTRKVAAADAPNVLTGAVAGTFGTVPATIVPSTTNTNAQGVIASLQV